MTCDHLNFTVSANVNRISSVEGGQITGYNVEVHVACSDCKIPFKFLGSRLGSHPSEPRLSYDQLELRAPLTPSRRRDTH